MLGVRESEIIWTSGATESNNTILFGFEHPEPSRRRILVGATEHKAVLDTADHLKTFGWVVDLVPVNPHGEVDMERYREMLATDVALVSLMCANNETGVIYSTRALADEAHEVGALFHSDCAQAPGRIPVDLVQMGVDYASFSAHKMYGPKGVGCMYVSRHAELRPLMHGGGHERGMRSGTTNVPGVVGFGLAAELVSESLEEDAATMRALRDALTEQFVKKIGDLQILGDEVSRLPNTLCIRFVGADAEAVMANASDLAISSGSACSALIPAASHVLRAMGISERDGFEFLRFSVGRTTTEEEISQAIDSTVDAVERVRKLAA
ncbi:NifS Cysteine sulfinate desulfinase/cysteine desulfurase and related enzymes [Acidimicrobiia bacterium]